MDPSGQWLLAFRVTFPVQECLARLEALGCKVQEAQVHLGWPFVHGLPSSLGGKKISLPCSSQRYPLQDLNKVSLGAWAFIKDTASSPCKNPSGKAMPRAGDLM